MSLITRRQEPCTVIRGQKVPDGEGGWITDWTEGESFLAAVLPDTSTQTAAAERQGLTRLFRVTTPKSAMLGFHDVFRRESDGQVFRVTSDGKDVQTPEESEITPFSQVTAEAWEIPLDGGMT